MKRNAFRALAVLSTAHLFGMLMLTGYLSSPAGAADLDRFKARTEQACAESKKMAPIARLFHLDGVDAEIRADAGLDT